MKGRRLNAPSDIGIRPTSDKVKEALFSILYGQTEGATFLDLYAGVGGVGIEALSRGASEVVFVESNIRHLQYLQQNLSQLQPIAQTIAVRGETVERFLTRQHPHPFDFIFVDPPYQSDAVEKILPIVADDDRILRDGRVIVEHFHKKVLPPQIGGLSFIKKYRYGETVLSFYARPF